MSDFIKDVIYNLKMEYGEEAVVHKTSKAMNLNTGIISSTTTDLKVSKAIPLPINIRAFFARAVGISKMAYLEPGQREILIDLVDFPNGIEIHDQVQFGTNPPEEIQRIDKYPFAAILISKS
jgi:hypothetical protein